MIHFSLDRAAGVLLGQACGDALGVPYEFGSARLGAHPVMIGGGLGDYAPGEWSDDTQMASCIAVVAATGADLTSAAALDEIAEGFLDWQRNGASDIGNQTARVLRAARRGSGPAGERLTRAAAADLAQNPKSAGNGALMRTSIVGLTRLDDRVATAAAARAVARLTHPEADAVDSCVLWSEAVRHAVVDGTFTIVDGLDLLDADRRDRWRDFLDAAQIQPPETFHRNGWTVTALQAAWSSIAHTPVPAHDPASGSFEALHVQHSLETAIRIGHDTDTVAAIAGGLLGARWGASALPARWRRIVHGWPGLRSGDLVRLACLTARGGQADREGWPTAATMLYTASPQPPVPHPHDDGVILGTVQDLGRLGDATVSLCRLGTSEIPVDRQAPEDHLGVWMIDHDDPAKNPHLDFLLDDIAEAIATFRAEGKTVFVHCVAAEQRTPSAALAYSRRLGHDAQPAGSAIKAQLPSARGQGLLWGRAAQVQPQPSSSSSDSRLRTKVVEW